MENIVNQADELTHQIKDNQELFDLAKEEGDKETLKTIQSDTEKISKLVEDVEFKRMFSNPMDPNNCFIVSRRQPSKGCSFTGAKFRVYKFFGTKTAFVIW